MNEEIILKMAQPYVKDGMITYDEFENLFSLLSLREQYDVIGVLNKNGIELFDKQTEDEALILDVEDSDDEDYDDEDFEILYDEAIFKDRNNNTNSFDNLVVHRVVKQSNDILCTLIQQGNRQAAQDLCVKNKRLVDKFVLAYEKRYGNRLDFEDLEQVGFIGLLKAAKRFDYRQGFAFSTYAVYWIKQSISREIMDNGYAIRIPVHMMERINKVATVYNRLVGERVLSLRDRIHQTAKELGLSDESVRECLILKENYLRYSSLESPVGEDGDSELKEFIPFEERESVEGVVMEQALHKELDGVLGKLEPREREIIKMRFGWNDGRPKTLEEIGKIYGLTRERIRQLEAKALRKIRCSNHTKILRDFLEEK